MQQQNPLLALIDEFKIERVYHLTASSSHGQIYQFNGLYARALHAEQGIICRDYISDDLSRSRDNQYGLDRYVHLSFTRDTPMYFVSQARNTHIKFKLLHINPRKALLLDGVEFTNEVANSSYSKPIPIDRMRSELVLRRPFPIDYRKGSATIEQFVKPKAQLLVPHHIPLNHIMKIEEL